MNERHNPIYQVSEIYLEQVGLFTLKHFVFWNDIRKPDREVCVKSDEHQSRERGQTRGFTGLSTAQFSQVSTRVLG